jgi:hypothetical protein
LVSVSSFDRPNAWVARRIRQVLRNGPPRGSQGVFHHLGQAVFHKFAGVMLVFDPLDIRDNAFQKRIAKIARRQRPSGNEAASQSEIVTSKTACRRFTIDVFINSCRSYVVNLNACCAAIVII